MKTLTKIFTVCLICVAPVAGAQTYDEDVVMKACSCIYNSEGDSIDSVVNSCLLKALLHSLAEDGIYKEKILQDISTPKSLENLDTESRTSFGEYLEMLYKNCSAVHYLVEKKQAKYYRMSNSGEANRYYLEGIDYEKKGEPDSAIVSYNKSLVYDSRFVCALDNASILYGKINEPDKAIDYCQRSLLIFPEGYNALLNLGAAFLTKEDSQPALAAYVKLIKYYPESPEGYFGLSLISFTNKDYIASTNLMKYAYTIYSAQNFDRTRDCKEYLQTFYYYMKKEGNDSVFAEIAGEFVPPLYQPENFDQLQSIRLNDEIDCYLAESQVLICNNYILSTPVNDSNLNRNFAAAMVKRWMAKTPDYIFHIDKKVAKILDKKGNVLSVFTAAMTKFCIENPEQGNDEKAVALYAWNTVLDYAANKANNIQSTGELKKMINAKKSGTLEKQLGF